MPRCSTKTFCLLVISGIAIPHAYGAMEQTVSPTVEELHAQLLFIQKESAEKYAALQREMDEKIRVLQVQIEELSDPGVATDTKLEESALADRALNLKAENKSFRTSVDFRLRYENTSTHQGLPERNRGVMRARFGASFAVNDVLSLGARITTGDPDDPNSSDVTMGNFVDDLEVSLDQSYAAFQNDQLSLIAGKFPNPLIKTDLVWDSDVNPFGIAGGYNLQITNQLDLGITGLYTVIDEQTIEDGSNMTGGQLSLRSHSNNDWSVILGVGYYDYSLGTLDNAGPGDTRGNNLTPDQSAYISDFNLLDFVAKLEYHGIGNRWPTGLIADYVRNLNAKVPEDTGYSLDLFVGQTKNPGDFLFKYGYAVNETDAVFAAFSHDNTTYSTNYQQHTLSLDYVILENVYLNLTAYKFRRENFESTIPLVRNDYVSRYRANLYFKF